MSDNIRLQLMRYTVGDLCLLCTVMHQQTASDMWTQLHDKIAKFRKQHDEDYERRGLRKDPLHMIALESVRLHLAPAEVFSLIKAANKLLLISGGAKKWEYVSYALRKQFGSLYGVPKPEDVRECLAQIDRDAQGGRYD